MLGMLACHSLQLQFTSEQGDEGDKTVLLHNLVELELEVVICVGLQCFLEQDPSTHQQVV